MRATKTSKGVQNTFRDRLPATGARIIVTRGNARERFDTLGDGAVVATLTATVELPLPAGTFAGLNAQEDKAGNPPQANVTSLGKLPGTGFTAMLNNPVVPRATETLGGAADIEKSNPGDGDAVKSSATECEILAVSVPTAFSVNE